MSEKLPSNFHIEGIGEIEEESTALQPQHKTYVHQSDFYVLPELSNERRLELHLAQRMLAYCKAKYDILCDQCHHPAKCRKFWDSQVVSDRGGHGAVKRLFARWVHFMEKKRHD